MNKKWLPFAVVGVVVGVGLLVWQITRTATGADIEPSTDQLVNEIPKAPAGSDQNFGPLDPRVSQGPPDMMRK